MGGRETHLTRLIKGVGQSGLMHISKIPKLNGRVTLGVGDIVTAVVDSVDLPRKRIALSLKMMSESNNSSEQPMQSGIDSNPSRPTSDVPKEDGRRPQSRLFAEATASAQRDRSHEPKRQLKREMERDREGNARMERDGRYQNSNRPADKHSRGPRQGSKRKREEEDDYKRIDIESLRDLEALRNTRAPVRQGRLTEKERERLEKEAMMAAKKAEGKVVLDLVGDSPPRKKVRLDLVDDNSQ